MIHKPSSQIESDIAARESDVLRIAEAAHHLASVIALSYAKYEAMDGPRLVNLLNADLTATAAMQQSVQTIAASINSSLDALDLPQFSRRSPYGLMRPDIEFDDGEFVYIPPPVPDLSQEPARP